MRAQPGTHATDTDLPPWAYSPAVSERRSRDAIPWQLILRGGSSKVPPRG